MTSTASGRFPHTSRLEANLPASTILATTDQVVGEVQESGVVTGVTYAPVANITGAASPASRTLTLVNKGQDGNGAVVVATLALLGGVNPLDFDEFPFVLSATPEDLVVAVGDILEVHSAPVGGTGLVDPGGRIQVSINRN